MQGARLLLRSPTLPAHLRGRLQGFEQRCTAALLVELARAASGTDGLLAPLLLAFGDVPATLGEEGLWRAVKVLPFPSMLQLVSSNELRVTSENDVLVRRGWGLGWAIPSRHHHAVAKANQLKARSMA